MTWHLAYCDCGPNAPGLLHLFNNWTLVSTKIKLLYVSLPFSRVYLLTRSQKSLASLWGAELRLLCPCVCCNWWWSFTEHLLCSWQVDLLLSVLYSISTSVSPFEIDIISNPNLGKIVSAKLNSKFRVPREGNEGDVRTGNLLFQLCSFSPVTKAPCEHSATLCICMFLVSA